MTDYQAPQALLQDKTVLITGASDGIGRACAHGFADYGATVILLGRSQEKLEKLYDEIEARHPGRVVIHPLDFSQATSDDYQLLTESLNQQFECLDGLIHNAGLLGARIPIEYYPDAEWAKVMEVNVNAVFYLTRRLLPALAASESGRIVFTSSSVGRVGRAHWGAYAVSKFALEGLMQTLADELRETARTRVFSLNPGATRTGMRQAAYPAEDPDTVPTPESLLPVFLYLMSEAAMGLHGKALSAREFDPEAWGELARQNA